MTEKTIALLSTKLDRSLTQDDQIAFMDYCAYYGLGKDEETEYVDSFIEECYHYTDDNYKNTGYLSSDKEDWKLELNTPDKLPFSHTTVKGNWFSWTWGGCTITKLDKNGL